MSYTKIIPLHDNVVIKEKELDESLSTTLIIPDTGKEKAMIGEVIAVGPGRLSPINGTLIPTSIKVGQTVTFPSFGGQRITINKEEYLIYKEEGLFAIIQ